MLSNYFVVIRVNYIENMFKAFFFRSFKCTRNRPSKRLGTKKELEQQNLNFFTVIFILSIQLIYFKK